MKTLVYLACPYSHPERSVRVERFASVNRCASFLMRAGVHVFSPISHTHPIAEHGLPKGWDFWEPYDRAFLEMSKAMLVCALDGWAESVGVKAEREIARTLGIPIGYIFYPDNEEYCRKRAVMSGLVSGDEMKPA